MAAELPPQFELLEANGNKPPTTTTANNEIAAIAVHFFRLLVLAIVQFAQGSEGVSPYQ